MGCAAGKEADEPDRQPPENEAVENKPKQEDPVDTRPPLQHHMLSEFWRAGSMGYNVPPHYIQVGSGPWAMLEKVPSQAHMANKIIVAGDRKPPRLVDTPDSSATEESGAATSSDAVDEIDLAQDDAGVFLRAYLPHSLSGYCVGWCRPDAPTSALTSSFVYDAATDGAADLAAVNASKPAGRDVSLRRRLLLFPKAVDAVGIFITDRTEPSRTFSSNTVAPLNRQCTSENTEPMDGALVTFSVVGAASNIADPEYHVAASPGTRMHRSGAEIGAQVKTVAAAYAENSLGVALLSAASTGDDARPIERRLTDDVTPARGQLARESDPVSTVLAERLLALSDGRHVLDVTMRFRYEQNELAAVYDRPAPHDAAAGIRVCGTYRPNGAETSSSSVTSDPIATGSFAVRLGTPARTRLERHRAAQM
jgi:hypothetical protein